MKQKILLILAILAIIFVSGCVQQKQDKTSVVYSPEEVWNNRVALENKQIVIEGIIQAHITCTKGAPPNGCSGSLAFDLDNSNRIEILGKYEGKSIGCKGTDTDGVSCYPFEREGKKYRITATLKKESLSVGDYYFLELQDFTTVNLPEDSCSNIKDTMQCIKNEHCEPIMGPSSCSPDDRICTADETFKECVSKE